MPLSPEGSGSSTPDVAVTDAEREQVVAILRSHCGDGTITLDEFADRVGVAFESTTRTALRTASVGKYESNALPLTVMSPLPGRKKTRATDLLRRPVPRY